MKKLLFLLPIIFVAAACGPYKQQKWVDIGTNETAYVIPLEQGNKDDQKMLRSVDYLEQNKVAARRVYINQIQINTGRMWWDYKYIPTDTVVVVHRAPVTREWTGNNQMGVESKESIGFTIPVNCTASVLEEDASTFLYHFGGQTIEWVIDHNVKPYILDYLTVQFGRMTMIEGQNNRNVVYDSMRVNTIKRFKPFGLTIMNLGVAGELTYTDEEIQTAINLKFTSNMKVEAAQNDVDAAKKFVAQAETIRKQKELNADVKVKEALADAIREGKLQVPQVIVMSGNKPFSLMDLYAAQQVANQKGGGQ